MLPSQWLHLCHPYRLPGWTLLRTCAGSGKYFLNNGVKYGGHLPVLPAHQNSHLARFCSHTKVSHRQLLQFLLVGSRRRGLALCHTWAIPTRSLCPHRTSDALLFHSLPLWRIFRETRVSSPMAQQDTVNPPFGFCSPRENSPQ